MCGQREPKEAVAGSDRDLNLWFRGIDQPGRTGRATSLSPAAFAGAAAGAGFADFATAFVVFVGGWMRDSGGGGDMKELGEPGPVSVDHEGAGDMGSGSLRGTAQLWPPCSSTAAAVAGITPTRFFPILFFD